MNKPNAPSRTNAERIDLPIARLDTQDAEQSLPIRQYLEQNGVAVVVGRKPAIGEEYHIICGDAAFVQATLASPEQKTTKLFVVLFLGNNTTIPESLEGTQAKVAAITGYSLSTRDTRQLFAYFFTGGENIYYLKNDERPADRVTHIMAVEKKKKKEIGRTDNKRGVLNISLVALSMLIAPTLWYLMSLGIIAAVQWYGVSALKKGDASQAATMAGLTAYWLGQGKGALAVIGVPARLFGQGARIRSEERVLSVIGDVAQAQTKAARLVTQGTLVVPRLFARREEAGESEVSLAVAIDRMRLELDGLTNDLGLAGAELGIIASDTHVPFTISGIKNLVSRVQTEIDAALREAETLQSLMTLYRAAGGFDEKKTYLILLQNSMELRPTGGFIGSIAIVTIEDGIMETPFVQDVYALDGQLKGHVDPPGPIAELLKQEHWYLRDSNWDPDFAVSGEKARWFYEKETAGKVDGVIAISSPLLTDLLGVTGPLDLPDYNDRITKENFFGKSLFYTKADFFPGSTQKKDFLGSVGVALISRITSDSPGSAPGLVRVVGRALEAGDIQFWFPDRQGQIVVEQAGWAGAVIRKEPCEAASLPCMVERIAVVESNMGVNKVNAFIKRSVKSRVDVGQDGGVDGTVALTYQNTSTDDAALTGGGVYLSYARMYLAADALVRSVLIDGVEAPYTATTENGSTIVGLAFTVPPGGEKTVTILYRRGMALHFVNNESLVVVSIRKQPGMINTNLDLAVGYPVGWSLKDVSPGLLANAREARYNTTLDQTKTVVVRFRK